MLNSMKKLQMLYAKSPEIHLAPSPAEQAVHGFLFTFNLRTFGYRLLLTVMGSTEFPFVIGKELVPHIAKKVFGMNGEG